MSRFLQSIALGAFVLVGAGCPAGTYYYDPYAYDSTYWYGYDTGIYYTYYDPFYDYYYYKGSLKQGNPPFTVDDIAARVATQAPSYYTPPTCVNATSAGATTTIVLTNCDTGPVGLRDISGTLTATFQIEGTNVGVTTSSTGLTVGGRPAQFSGSGMSTRDASNLRTFTGTSNGDLVGRTGKMETRTSQINIAWMQGSGCVTINSSGTLESDGVNYASQLSNFQKCATKCPTAGTLMLMAPKRTVTLTFDGSDNPEVTASDTSDTSNINLSCEAQ